MITTVADLDGILSTTTKSLVSPLFSSASGYGFTHGYMVEYFLAGSCNFLESRLAVWQ